MLAAQQGHSSGHPFSLLIPLDTAVPQSRILHRPGVGWTVNLEPVLAAYSHRLPIPQLVLEEGLLARLGPHLDTLFPAMPCLLAADPTTWSVAGPTVEASLRACGRSVQRHILRPSRPGATVQADDDQVEALRQTLEQFPHALLLALGSGTVNDVAKLASFKMERPYITIPTAPSMNGYTSPIAAIRSQGLKTTQPCHLPRACLVDLQLVAQAPYRMLAAGLGDSLSKPVSHADWLLSHYLLETSYNTVALPLMEESARLLQDVPGPLPTRSLRTVGALMAALCLSGLGMALAGSSAPASGGEHLISHYLDMTAGPQGADLHGCQVGVATLVTASFYQYLLGDTAAAIDIEARLGALSTWSERTGQIKRHFGPLATAVLPQARALHPTAALLRQRLHRLQHSWPELAASLAANLRPPAAIAADLHRAGAPSRFAELGLSPHRARHAILYGKDIRDRYTILHLAAELGQLDAWTNRILADELHAGEAPEKQPKPGPPGQTT